MLVLPQDFPFLPDTGDCITGVKAMEILEVGYELTKYLDKHIEDGTINLKDLILEMCGEADWNLFSETYVKPEKNADAFCDFIQEDDSMYPYSHILVLETDGAFVFVPVTKEDEDSDNYDTIGDLHSIVEGMCIMCKTAAKNPSNSAKSSNGMPLAKAEVKVGTTVTPIFEPAFTKL